MIPAVYHANEDGTEVGPNGVSGIRELIRSGRLLARGEVYEKRFLGAKGRSYTAIEYLTLYEAAHKRQIIASIVIVVAVVGLFGSFVLFPQLYDGAPASAPPSEQAELHSRYLALKAEETRLKKELDAARARRDSSAIPELSRKVDDLSRRMYALTAEKLQADREGKK